MSNIRGRSHGLALVTALTALFQAVSAIRALQVPPDVAQVVRLPLALEFIVGVLWALVFAWITLHLIRLSPLARRRAYWLLAGFVTYSLFRLLLFAQADYDRQRLPFLWIVTALIAAAALILWRQDG